MTITIYHKTGQVRQVPQFRQGIPKDENLYTLVVFPVVTLCYNT